ncbi:MAG: MBG domain-containing protein, partial [Bacteroidales bacterium]|nr:MBG domain-containing protein [Bacteroidales bacterium]
PSDHAQGAGTYTVTASVADNDYYFGAEATATLTVSKARPALSINSVFTRYSGNPVNINVPEITGSKTADADLRPGLVYEWYKNSDPATKHNTQTGPTNADAYTVTVRTPGDANHLAAEATGNIYIGTSAPTMFFQNVEKVYDGAALALPTAAIVPMSLQAGITYTITPVRDGYGGQITGGTPVAEVINAGEYTDTARIASDGNYSSGFITATLTIRQRPTMVEMHSKSVHYGVTPINMAPVVTTTPADDAVDRKTVPVAGATATITGYRGINGTNYPASATQPTAVGEYEVTAAYAGDNNYLPSEITATLSITQASAPRIDMEDVTATYDVKPHYVDSASVVVWSPAETEDGGPQTSLQIQIKDTDHPEGLVITYTYHDAAGRLVEKPTNAGNYTITATTVATAEYAAAEATAQLFILKAPQSIRFDPPASVPFGTDPFEVAAFLVRPSGAHDRPLFFVSDDAGIATIVDLTDTETDPAKADSARITPLMIGTVNFTVSETSNNNFIPVTVTRTMRVTKAVLTVTLNDFETVYTGKPVNIAPARVGGEVSGANHSGVVYSYEGTGTTTYPKSNTPPTNAGTYTVTATVPANEFYDEATDDATLTIGKSTPTIGVTGGSRDYTGEEQPIDDPVITGADPGTKPEIIYTGKEKDGDDYGPTTTPPTEAGDYTVTVTVPGDDNHETVTKTVTLEVNPANPDLNLDGADDKVYDGDPAIPATVPGAGDKGLDVDIVYEGTGEDGTHYGPLPTPPTNAGHYTVTAVVTDPSGDYNDVTLTKDFDITKATPAIDIHNKTTKYDGSGKTIDQPTIVQDDATGQDQITVTYYDKTGTELTSPPVVPGDYVVKVYYPGDNNYTPKTDYGSLVITAASPEITLRNKTVTYNGQPQAIEPPAITPADVPELTPVVVYHNAGYPPSTTPPTNAGVYSVTASTPGTTIYDAGSATALLIIERAPQTITFEPPETVTAGTKFPADATVSTGKTLTYRSGNTGIATVDETTGEITALTPGVVVITVLQAGDDNYLPANVSRSITVTRDKCVLDTVNVNGDDIPVADYMPYLLPCGPREGMATVMLSFPHGATVSYTVDGITKSTATATKALEDEVTFDVPIDKPQIKTVTITVTEGGRERTYTLAIECRFAFDALVLWRWDNTLTIINNPANNGGYTFSSYKWYRGATENGPWTNFAEGQSWSAGPSRELLNETDWYYAEVTTTDGTVLHTCPGQVVLKNIMKAVVWPNPAAKGQTVYVQVDTDDESTLDGAVIEVYNASGNRIDHLQAQGRYTPVPASYQAGVYLFVLRGKDGFRKEMKVIVH